MNKRANKKNQPKNSPYLYVVVAVVLLLIHHQYLPKFYIITLIIPYSNVFTNTTNKSFQNNPIPSHKQHHKM